MGMITFLGVINVSQALDPLCTLYQLLQQSFDKCITNVTDEGIQTWRKSINCLKSLGL